MSDIIVAQQNAVRPPPLSLGINVEKPKFPQYAVYSKRLESFDAWPEHIPVKKEDLVKAGLVYTGVGDRVLCYFCGGGLKNWERDDVPMEEHAKWYPKCPHIMLVKGQSYVERLIRGEKPDEDGPQSQSSEHDLLNNIPAQSCIQMGFSEEIVRRAIDVHVNKTGTNNYTGQNLCEIIYELEDPNGHFRLAENVEGNAPGVNGVDKEEQANDDDELSLPTLREENARLKEIFTCIICTDDEKSVLFLPCGHLVCCDECAARLTTCPVCRRVIEDRPSVFFARLSDVYIENVFSITDR